MNTISEAIKHLKQGKNKSVMRGNILWCVKDCELYAYKIYKQDEWKWDEYHEKDSIPFYSCPMSYLDMTTPYDIQWRQEVRNQYDNKYGTMNQIRKDFLKFKYKCEDCDKIFKYKGKDILQCPNCESLNILSEKEMFITLQTDRKEYFLNVKEVKLEQVQPCLIGRSTENYQLYQIPIKFIDKVEVKERNIIC